VLSGESRQNAADHNNTIDARYERTLASTYHFRKRGYVIEKWECDFNRKMCENPEMSDFLKNHTLIKSDPLDPRDVFFGSRIGNIATRYEITGNYRENTLCGRMLSVFVCVKNGCFPIRSPYYIDKEYSELIGKASNINFDSVEDLVRYKVLPLRNLFHPIFLYIR